MRMDAFIKKLRFNPMNFGTDIEKWRFTLHNNVYTHINESLLQKKLKGNIENIFAKRQNKAMSENGQITDKTQILPSAIKKQTRLNIGLFKRVSQAEEVGLEPTTFGFGVSNAFHLYFSCSLQNGYLKPFFCYCSEEGNSSNP